ncbi:hypothetical protein FHS43_006010 [Streptosporangium becharense]|uniref:Uncharacterized protein n=1 Tax=Streptosporangium becharense TaxID=1816182 RepID=A0A7W9MHT0_9ACTN|nr:hypothetical protein [Streptosporangium becharense]MBB2914698.1 hypothetical protein [Streptosporangium becharense]MBB5820901.1 hypothetical protein [Streptosporangium becharense]
MRSTLRRVLAVGAALALIGVATPGAAYSQADPESCNELLGPDTPAYVVCHWLAKPDEALGVALFWGADDGANLKGAGPVDGKFIDCSAAGASCPKPEDSVEGDENSPLPEGAGDDGAPQCEAGQQCSVDGHDAGGSSERVAENSSGLPPATTPTPTQDAAAAAAAQTPAGQAITAAKAAQFRIWIDTELADDWKAGPEAFAAAVKRIGALASRPEVAGIRFTSQLGYNKTFATNDEIKAFVAAASDALRQAAPGKRLGVHTVVPELACGADDACKAEMRKRHPLLNPEQVESPLIAGRVDQLSLDTGLLYGGYDTWKINAEQAHRNQWIQVRARSWDVLTQVAAEETGLVGQVSADQVAIRLSVPVKDGAAQQVNVWTRVQGTQGAVNRLTAWDEVKKLNPIQRRLAAVYDPASPEADLATDLKKLSEAFGQIYLTVT